MEGRQAILTALHRRFAAAETGGAACIVSGAEGAGKTYLADHFLGELPNRVARLRGRGLRTGVAPLLPVCEALRTCSRGTTSAKFRAVAEEYIESVPFVKEALAPLVRAKRTTSHGRMQPGRGLPSEAHSFFVLAQLIESLGGEAPAVLFLDDIQWIDPSSIGFIGYLASQLQEKRVFLLLTRRLNGQDDTLLTDLLETLRKEAGPRAFEISLAELTQAEVRAVAENSVGRVDLSDADVEWLQASTQGKPYYLLELLELLRDRGILRATGNVWRLDARPAAPVPPPSLQAHVRDRVRRASGTDALAREAVQFGACLGAVFDVRTVADALKESPRRVASALSELVDATHLVRRLGMTTIFLFDHELTREAVLADLGDFAEEIHGRLAATLASKPDADPASVAYHFAAAGDVDSGARWYLDAGERAAKAGLYDSTLRYGRLAKDLLSRSAAPGEGLERATRVIGASLVGAERYADAVRELSESDRAGELPAGARHLLGRAEARIPSEASRRRAVVDLRQALDELGPDELGARAAIWCDLAHAHDSLGDYAQSQRAFRSAVAAAKRGKDPSVFVRALRLTSMFWQPEKVCEALTGAIRLAKKNGLRMDEALAENDLGSALFALRQLPAARDHYDRALALLKSLGGYRCDVPLNNLGLIRLVEGELGGARALFEDALSHSRDVHNRLFIRSNGAVASALGGDVAAALAQLRDLATDADATGDAFYTDCIRHNLAEALLESGAAGEAVAAIHACGPHHLADDDLLIHAKRAALLARALHAQGEPVPDALIEEESALERTTKPQAWLYREPWYFCDIVFWED